MKPIRLIIFLSVCLILSSCKKYLQLGPPSTQLTAGTLFTSDATAIAAQTAIYAQMEANGLNYLLLSINGMASDESFNYDGSPDATGIATNNIAPNNGIVYEAWANLYKYIYQANAVKKGLQEASAISERVRRQLQGEALFVRALCHFLLVNWFGDIPYITTTDHRQSALESRKNVSAIYDLMIEDLLLSKTLLSPEYLSGTLVQTSDRVRPNQYAVSALLARVYLYKADWQKAEVEATVVINQTALYNLPSLSHVFLKNSTEAIWQLMAVLPNYNSFTGGTLVPSPFPYQITVNTGLIADAEIGDQRLNAWTQTVASGNEAYVFPFKYQVGQNAGAITEYSMILRLAEQYLIRAESRLKQNDLAGCVSDLDVIRNRAGLLPTSASSEEELLKQIYKERRIELMGELGDRWFDLKRTNKVNDVMFQNKPRTWTDTDQLFPIPQIELDRNPNLTQNPGY